MKKKIPALLRALKPRAKVSHAARPVTPHLDDIAPAPTLDPPVNHPIIWSIIAVIAVVIIVVVLVQLR